VKVAGLVGAVAEGLLLGLPATAECVPLAFRQLELVTVVVE
jgi:hypothetical protein